MTDGWMHPAVNINSPILQYLSIAKLGLQTVRQHLVNFIMTITLLQIKYDWILGHFRAKMLFWFLVRSGDNYSFKFGTRTFLSNLQMLITLLWESIKYDWILGYFWSKLVIWLLQWNSYSYYIFTWQKDNL